jgi:hypothetical protein
MSKLIAKLFRSCYIANSDAETGLNVTVACAEEQAVSRDLRAAIIIQAAARGRAVRMRLELDEFCDEPPRWRNQPTAVEELEDWTKDVIAVWAAEEETAALEKAVTEAMAAVDRAVAAARAPKIRLAAAIIQAAARGRMVRAWSAWNSSASVDGLEEAWEAALAWAEAKAQEREAATTKAISQTDTDESYDSDESEVGVSIQPLDRRAKSALFAGSESDNSDLEDLFVVAAPPPKPKLPAGAAASGPLAAMAGLMKVGEVVRAKVYSLDDAAAAAAMWRDDAQADAYECVAAAKAVKKFWANVDATNAAKSQAATIIQAAERGRVVRMVMVIVAEATNVLRLSKVVAVDWEGIAVARAVLAMGVAGETAVLRAVATKVVAVMECHAATIIQAAARGRAVRSWNTRFAEMLAGERRYLKRHGLLVCHWRWGLLPLNAFPLNA